MKKSGSQKKPPTAKKLTRAAERLPAKGSAATPSLIASARSKKLNSPSKKPLSGLKKSPLIKAAAKLEAPVSIHPTRLPEADLPAGYNQTRLVLMVRDPYWAYGYWDFSTETWKWIQDFLRRQPGTRVVLRVHNLDHGRHDDLDVHLEAKNWYLHLGLPDISFEAELGLVDPSGKFHSIVKSNRIRTPRDKPSSVIDPNWDAKDFDELYRLSGGGRIGSGSDFLSSFRKR